MKSIILLVLALSACAAAPPPPATALTQASTPPVALPAAESMHKAEDLSCLTDAQRTEFDRQVSEAMTLAARTMGETVAANSVETQMRRVPPVASAGARAELDRCEANLAPGEDKTTACAAPRLALEKTGTHNPLARAVLHGALAEIRQLFRTRQAIRARFPLCGVPHGSPPPLATPLAK